MKIEDAKKVADNINFLDVKCSTCLKRFCKQMNEDFPQFIWSVKKTKEFGNCVFVAWKL